MTEFILVRHGETDWNRELRFQGQIDIPLNATGHEQARRLAERLGADRVQIDHLRSSDLVRAQQTAAPLLHTLLPTAQAASLTDARWREQSFGAMEGLRVPDIQRDHADAWAHWLRFDPDGGMPGGETARQFHTRVIGALQQEAQAQRGRTVMVVTHGGVLDMVWRTAQNLGLAGPRRSAIPNAAYNRVRVGEDGKIDILHWADARHLEGLPEQPVYDQTRLTTAAREQA
jgi:probable phosphoglycerate mutase